MLYYDFYFVKERHLIEKKKKNMGEFPMVGLSVGNQICLLRRLVYLQQDGSGVPYGAQSIRALL